jgi:transposase InsO family protein
MIKSMIFPRFGTLRILISDGGTHFTGKNFKKCLSKLGIEHRISMAYHPQTNVSVRKVVLTLTSKSAEIYISMTGAKQLGDTGFILVPAGGVRPAVVCSRNCIALHRSACRGGLQARRERRSSLQVPEVFRIEASANILVKAEIVRVNAIRRPPAARGLPFLL